MKVSDEGVELIQQFEGCRLKAYLDSVGIPTIGYGTIMYPSGQRVKMGEKITQEDAMTYLKYEVSLKSKSVNAFVSNVVLNQNQFDALVSFAYNVGIGGLQKSTLLKKVIKNPNDPSIRNEFLKWDKGRVNGKLTTLAGLTKRRQREADLYFKK